MYVISSNGGPPRQIRSNGGWAGYPVWATDSKHILYANRGSSEPDWYVSSLDDRDPVATGAYIALRAQKLQGQGVNLFVPEEWTPDGGYVLLVARLGSAANIWRVPISTKSWRVAGTPGRLTSGAGLEVEPSVGVDGRLLFASHTKNLDIWALAAEASQAKVTGAPQRLTQDAAADYWPEISADGTKLAFRSDRAGTMDIWTKDLASGVERRLTAGDAVGYGPWISGDGASIGYNVRENQQNFSYVLNARTGVPRKVCENCGLFWQLSSDGALATYTTYGPSPNASTAILLEVASGQKHDLLKHNQNVFDVRLSPDGKWVAFHVQNRLETRRIFVAPLHDWRVGPEWIPITDGEGFDRNASWSPDGGVLYYQSEREGFRCIWARRLNAATKRPLGPPVPIFHSHHARLSLTGVQEPSGVGPSIARDKVVSAKPR